MPKDGLLETGKRRIRWQTEKGEFGGGRGDGRGGASYTSKRMSLNTPSLYT